MACPMVLQAVLGDVQVLLLCPLTPFTYHVVLARAVEVRVRKEARSKWLDLTTHTSVAKVPTGAPKDRDTERREPDFKCPC